MRISTPLISKARKHRAVIQWVRRTIAECRFATLAAGTAELDVGAQTESAILQSVTVSELAVHPPRAPRKDKGKTLSGTRQRHRRQDRRRYLLTTRIENESGTIGPLAGA